MEEQWWAASLSKNLSEKLGEGFRQNMWRTAVEYFKFGGLTRVQLLKDSNVGGDYWRFFGFFEGDSERYFDTFRHWNLSVEASSLQDGQSITVGEKQWRTEIMQDPRGPFFEFTLEEGVAR